MKKMYGLISKILLAILIIVQVAGMNGMGYVKAASAIRLSYVLVSGGYFDTGILINQDYSIEMVFSVSDVNQYKNYYVATTSDNQRVFRLRNEVGKGLYAAYGWYNGNVYTMKANEEMTVSQRKNITYINNKQVQNSKVQNLQAATTLKFGDLTGYIKSFRVWNETNTLVANYVPVLDGSGKACMYDTIKGKYVYYTGKCQPGENVTEEQGEESQEEIKSDDTVKEDNSSSSDKLESSESTSDSGIVFVDALELKGGQFDTGIKVSLNDSLETVFSLSTLNQYKNIYESTNNKSRVFRLRYELSSGFNVSYGWYGGKVYKPEQNEKITLLQKKNITYINGNQVQKATVQTLESDTTLKFGDFVGTIECFRIWNESNKLVAEFLPALDSNKKACMYDTVSKKYIYYTGTCQAVLEEEEDDIIISELPNYGSSRPVLNVKETLFKEKLLELLETGDTTPHDFSEYGYTWQKVSELFEEVTENEGRIPFASCANMYYTTTKTSDGLVLTLKLENIDDGYVQRYQSLKKIVENVVNQSEGMTELEKTILAHDYVVSHCSYKDGDLLTYTAGGALVEGKALCVGYARAMVLLLQEMGVESEVLKVSSMNHAWVKVKVNGKWYHADPTWDDTRSAVKGKVDHTFLLRTDAEYLSAGSNKHYGWEGTISTDTTFTGWSVHDIVGELHHSDGNWYYIDAEGQKITVDINK
ncbi:MAG: hypothetical protein MR531_16315 [Lachnospiraceae bacterium]|nr:hypothetical protein [Lachnospiraceae bacterium]